MFQQEGGRGGGAMAGRERSGESPPPLDTLNNHLFLSSSYTETVVHEPRRPVRCDTGLVVGGQ